MHKTFCLMSRIEWWSLYFNPSTSEEVEAGGLQIHSSLATQEHNTFHSRLVFKDKGCVQSRMAENWGSSHISLPNTGITGVQLTKLTLILVYLLLVILSPACYFPRGLEKHALIIVSPCSDTLSAPACFLIRGKCFAQPQHKCSPISASCPAGTGIGVGQFHLFCTSLSAQLRTALLLLTQLGLPLHVFSSEVLFLILLHILLTLLGPVLGPLGRLRTITSTIEPFLYVYVGVALGNRVRALV